MATERAALARPATFSAAGGVSAGGLIQTTYNGSGSGGEAIYATAGGIRSDAGGTALYLPNGNIVCQTIAVAGTDEGGTGSGVAIRCTSGAVESDHSGTAFYAPNGNVVCVSLTQSSDIRIKRDVWGYDAGLAEVTALRPITYCFNGRGGTVEDGRRHIGLIADEVEGVMPEMVGTGNWRQVLALRHRLFWWRSSQSRRGAAASIDTAVDGTSPLAAVTFALPMATCGLRTLALASRSPAPSRPTFWPGRLAALATSNVLAAIGAIWHLL